MLLNSKLRIKIIEILSFFLSKKYLEEILSKKYLFFYRTQSVIFIHIPKAAGTSITNVIYGKRNGHLKGAFVKKKLGKEYEEKYTFSVSRNPYDRLYSAYKFATQGQTKDGAIANASFYKNNEFRSFESFIEEWLVNQQLTKLDPVFQPQYTFVFNNENQLIVDDLFKLEEIEKVEKTLSFKLKRTISIKKKNVTSSNSQQTTVYTSDLKSIVYDLYEKDFKLLGYEK